MMLKYLMLHSEIDLTKSLTSETTRKQKMPMLADNTKTKISYLILSFNPYLHNLKLR